MDKLLVNQFGEVMCFDQDQNALKQIPYGIEVRTVFVADKDGQAISENEVVDFKAGDIILTLSKWKNDKLNPKIMVVTDIVAKDDITRWYNEMMKKDEAS